MERAAEIRHELFRGEVFAMAGATRGHNLIATNFVAELRNALRQRRCEAYSSDMRIRIPATGLYTYPDASAVCGEPRFEDEHRDTLLNPQLIVEVLSDSTEGCDRGKKFEQYRTVPSLTDYVLVSQKEVLVEHFTRQADGAWALRERRAGERVDIGSLRCSVAVDEIYLKVFAQPAGVAESS